MKMPRSAMHRLLSTVGARLSALPVALRVLITLVLAILLCTLLLLLPGITTRPLTFGQAFFTATSALTVTGLSVITPAVDLTVAGQVLLLVMVQVGGIGLMVFTVVVFRLLGRRITLVDRLALRNMFGTLLPGAVLRLTARVLATMLVFEGVGALLLWLNWRAELGSGRAALFAVFHSVSAFCNSGFDLFTGRPGYTTFPTDSGTLAVLGGLIFTGSLGVPVIADLLALPWDRRLTLNTRLTLVFIALLLAVSTLVIFLSEGVRPGVLAAEPWDRRLGLALFQSISARTAGFVGLPSFEALSSATQFILIVMMFIGAAPASMGGGITTGTAIVLGLALISYARGQEHAVVNGRTISSAAIHRATAVLVISLLVVAAGTLLLLFSDAAIALDTALFEVVSAFATTGLSLAYTTRLNGFGQAVIILVMVWGRLGALSVATALARPVPQALVTYPEEQILIG